MFVGTNKLVKYNDFGDKIKEYTSEGEEISHWLKPVYEFAREESEFHCVSDERASGWYIDKGLILIMLQKTIPDTENIRATTILDELKDFITGYQEPPYDSI